MDAIELAQPAVTIIPSQADTDAQLIGLWLYGRSPRTQRAYRADVTRFLDFTGKPLRFITLGDLQQFADSLGALAPASQARMLSSIKSLLTFAQKAGYLQFNPGAALILPKAKNTMGERIMSERAVQRLLALESNPRNHVLLAVLYYAGLRVSELCDLRWRDVQPHGETVVLAIHGKGQKTRFVKLKEEVADQLQHLRDEKAAPDAPVFRSRKKGGALVPVQVFRIVKAAALRAGLPAEVSPHWLRHAHASHALDRGAPISLVQATLGHASVQTTGKYTHARPNDSSSRYLP